MGYDLLTPHFPDFPVFPLIAFIYGLSCVNLQTNAFLFQHYFVTLGEIANLL